MEHKEHNSKTREQRQLSRRAQLRNLQKVIEKKDLLIEHLVNRNSKVWQELTSTRNRLAATQKLLPWWIRSVP